MAARGARGALRGREGWRLGIRNWLSKRREYARTVPETESGVGPMDAVFTKCERCGQPIYEKHLRARADTAAHRRREVRRARQEDDRRGPSSLRELRGEAGGRAREDRARRRR